MADDIQRIIYKTEVDDAGYIRGLEAMSASTKAFTDQQQQANKRLQENEAALKALADVVEKDRKALETYSGTDAKFRKQLEDSLKTSQTQYAKTAELVATIRKKYEEANKAAQDFANTASKATQIQQQTTGGKIPTPGAPTAGVPAAAQSVAEITQSIITTGALGELPLIAAESKDEFEKLRVVISLAEQDLRGLDSASEEFKLLSPIVEQGKDALEKYDNAAKAAGNSSLTLSESTVRLRTQILQGRDELIRMEQAGLSTTKAFTDLESHVASLTQQYREQKNRLQVLSSETRALDFGKSAVQSAISGFQAYTSITILAGGASEELQKKTLQLFAAMQLLSSLEQLTTTLRRGGVIATNLQSAAQATYAAIVGASTGALRTFRIALATTGIGAAIVAIAFLVTKYQQMRDAIKEANERQKLFRDINKEADKSITEHTAKLELFRLKLIDLSIPQAERIRLAKIYNTTADESAKIDLKQINNIDLLNAAIDRQILQIQKRAIATAAEAVLAKRASEVFLEQENARERAEKTLATQRQLGTIGPNVVLDANAEGKIVQRVVTDEDRLAVLIANDPKLKAAKEKFQKTVKEVGATIDINDLIAIETKEKKKKGEIENVFAQKLKELQARLAEVTAKSFESEGTIRKQFAASLEKEITDINELLKKKQLTKAQSEILINLTTRINTVQLAEALKEFNKKVTDARKKLNDELSDLQQKANQDSINLIQDEFERRARLIDLNEKQELENAKRAQEERLTALDFEKQLIGEQAYQTAKAEIISIGEEQALIIQRRAAQARQDLAADSFKKILDAYQNAIVGADLIRDEGIAQQIRNISDRFLAVKISYKTFQDDITKIQRDAESIRRDATLATQRNELADLDRHLAAIVDRTSKEYKDLIKLRDELRAKIAAGEKEDAEKDAANKQTGIDERTQKIISYTDAIGQLADSVIGFWQRANDEEEKSLDKSISLQEKRVDAARRIAERGNAEYLKQEEDRLTQLNVQRENAARRQLAIDAALQASQLLVGITGAIAKIASGIGAAETIAEIAIIVAALATGYGLVKSLQGNQPKLAEGELYVTRGKNKPGIDTIPAWLSEGEAVTSAEKNKAYHPTMKAIHTGSVPPERLNHFVTTFHRIKPVPQVNYQRIKEAAEIHINQDGRMAAAINEQNRLIVENNDLQRRTLDAMKKMSVSASIDRDGVAIMVNEWVQQKKIDSKL